VRRRADVVFPARRLAVFVDGCFWHGCDVHARSSKTNAGWWARKIAANKARDRETDARLLGHGWTVVRVWEHEDPESAADRVAAALERARRTAESGRGDAS
jgi:DNA mismatch endonuclease (patch repair protein)